MRESGTFPFTGAIAIVHGLFHEETRLHLVNDVQCLGNETELLNCAHDDNIGSNCGQRNDAGVVCQGKEVYILC